MKKETLEAMVDILVQECLAQRKQLEQMEGYKHDVVMAEKSSNLQQEEAEYAREAWKKWRALAHKMAILWEGFRDAPKDGDTRDLTERLSKYAKTILEDEEIAGILADPLSPED